MADSSSMDQERTSASKVTIWNALTVFAAVGVAWLLYLHYSERTEMSQALEDSYAVQAYRVSNDRSYDVDCMDFESSASAQRFFETGQSVHGESADLFSLDPNGNGRACDAIYDPIHGGDAWEDITLGVSTGGVRAWLIRGIDCSTFNTRDEAQYYFNSLGGPAYDPFNLDDDNDGRACELLP